MDKTKLYAEIGHRIKKRRKQLGMSQENLAELMGVTPQMISTAENGTKGIRPENIIKFSKALNLSCDYILTGQGNSVDMDAIIHYCNTLGDDNFERIVNIFQALQRLSIPPCEDEDA